VTGCKRKFSIGGPGAAAEFLVDILPTSFQEHDFHAFLRDPIRSRVTSSVLALHPMAASYLCPVCDYPKLSEPPRSEFGGGSFEICPSCGFQFGVNDDAEGISYETWRRRWESAGMPWRSAIVKKPDFWEPVARHVAPGGAALRRSGEADAPTAADPAAASSGIPSRPAPATRKPGAATTTSQDLATKSPGSAKSATKGSAAHPAAAKKSVAKGAVAKKAAARALGGSKKKPAAGRAAKSAAKKKPAPAKKNSRR